MTITPLYLACNRLSTLPTIKPPQMTKQCSSCAQEKPLSEFYWRKDTQKHHNHCKTCHRDYQDVRRYGKSLKRENMPCEICGDIKETLCIDHDHNTGEIRGLLCHNCNRGIGLLNDNIENLERAVLYLRSAKK